MYSKGTTLFFCMLMFSFPSINCWKDYPFPTEWSWQPWWKSGDYKWGFLVSLFYCIGLYVCHYASTPHFLWFFISHTSCNSLVVNKVSFIVWSQCNIFSCHIPHLNPKIKSYSIIAAQTTQTYILCMLFLLFSVFILPGIFLLGF